MIIIRNSILPPKSFGAINLFGILFVRKEFYLNEYDLIHETIHTKQMLEMLVIFFYLWYVIEWLIRLVKIAINKGDIYNAYWNLSFEEEARDNQYDRNYLKNRKPYSWIKYYGK